MAGALPARAVRPLDAVIFVPRAYSDARRAVDAMEKRTCSSCGSWQQCG